MPLLFAFFLASSWTWCIGMYLPIMLMRDFGSGGWWVFAVPNVIGAAAMGWVLSNRNEDVSRRLVSDHRDACWWFSVVTIAFHVYFLSWKLGPIGWIALAPAIVVGLASKKNADACVAAMLTWLVSGAAMVLLARSHDLSPVAFFKIDASPTQLLALAAPCVLGFVLCPYLDLTFHRARQGVSADGQSRLAFTLGFGVLFFPMIVFTPMYGTLLTSGRGSSPWSYGILLVHVLMQAVLTMALHWRSTIDTGRGVSTLLLSVVIGLLGYGVVEGLSRLSITQHAGLEIGEVVYRSFMAFYGLVAPAYVLLVMTRGKPVRRNLTVMFGAVVLSMPFYWIGFIERQMSWAVAGVGVLVLARIFTRPATVALQSHGISIKTRG